MSLPLRAYWFLRRFEYILHDTLNRENIIFAAKFCYSSERVFLSYIFGNLAVW